MKIRFKICRMIMLLTCLFALAGLASAQTPKPGKPPTVQKQGDTKVTKTGTPPNSYAILPDLSLRTDLYFTGAKTDSIDLANDPHVETGKSFDLQSSQAVSSGGGFYAFNVGFLALRTGGVLKSPFSAYTELKYGGITGNDAVFAANEQIKQMVMTVKLKAGANTVTCLIDPDHKITELNENNNSFTVTINVITPKPPIKIAKKIDLTTTWELYLLKDQTSKTIDKKNDQVIGDTTSATLYESKAMHCNTNPTPQVCGFKVGFVAIKTNRVDQRAQNEYFVYDNGKKVYGAGMDLVEGVATMDVVFLLKLTVGSHDITITVDPENKIAEQDETNNSITVHLNVQ